MSKAIDWTHIIKNYPGQWVGLKDDEQTVISNGNSVKEVMEHAKEKGYTKPILFHVPTQVLPYVGIG